MNASEKMGATSIQYHEERCLRDQHECSRCSQCQRVCPVHALSWDGEMVKRDARACVGCGACLAACPTEALTSRSFSERNLLSAVQDSRATLAELVCPKHPEAECERPRDEVLVLGVCLAALTPGLLFECGLATPVRVRVHACEGCELGCLREQIADTVSTARSWLASAGRDGGVVLATEGGAQVAPRKIRWAPRRADSSRVSRRDFLRGLRDGSSLLASFYGLDREAVKASATRADTRRGKPHTPAWRAALAKAWPSETEAIPSSMWPSLVSNGGCSGCMLCERCCPTGALHSAVEGSRFIRRFTPGLCIGCRLCVSVCSERSPQLEATDVSQPFEAHVVRETATHPCSRCGGSVLGAGVLCFHCASEPHAAPLLADAARYLLKPK